MKTSPPLCAILAFAAAAAVAAQPLPLFEGGSTKWVVVLPEGAPPPVAFAAQELTNALAKVSGAAFPVVARREGDGPAIRFEYGDEKWCDEIVAYKTDGRDLVLSGNQPRAALHAAYAFLQRELGVRWLWPGEDGAFFPQRDSWSMPAKFGYRHTPSIRYRGFHHCGDWRDRAAFNLWQTRNFAVIHRHGVRKEEARYGQYCMIASHNANLNRSTELFKEHPECFAELGGKRCMLNVCFASDLAAEKVAEKLAGEMRAGQARGLVPTDILEIFPNDNQDYCQCAKCREMGVSNGWFSFYNKVVGKLSAQFPEMRFATLAYQGYRDVPANPVGNTEFVEYASHGRCHIHKFGDPSCKSNVAELKRLEDWCARGGVPMGHYAYEYDSISRHWIFMPFFSVIGDAVETSAKLGLVTQIPEISLSPAKGPDIQAHAIQNRLTILYYAWKMWDASLTLEDFLADITSCAFGKAAAQMKEYFLLLDGAWGRMEGSISLFADGMHVATRLLADNAVREKAGALLAEAERLAAADERPLRNVLREKALFGQMLDNRALATGNDAVLHFPRLGVEDAFDDSRAPWRPLLRADGAPGDVFIRGCWRAKEEKRGAKTVIAGEELVIAWRGTAEGLLEISGEDGESYSFGYKGGVKSQRMVSEVGVEVATWAPEWRVEEKDGGLVFHIPLTAFRRRPEWSANWRGRLSARGQGYPFRDDLTARIMLIAAGRAERPMAYYPGEQRANMRANYLRAIPSIRLQAEEYGWELIPCTNRQELAAAATRTDTFYLCIPDRDCVSPETAAIIREKVRAGGTIYARSYHPIPLGTILGDPAVKCHVGSPKDFPLGQRKAKWVREGDWCRKPWNVEQQVRHSYAPCYMQVPDGPAGAWIEYASMPARDNPEKMLPFISAMKYGDGAVIIAGESLNVSVFRLIDNLRQDLGCN